MFSVKKSSNPAIRSKRQFTDRGAKSAAEELPRLGRTSRQVGEKMESTSSNVSMKVSGAPNTTISGNAITIDVDPMLTGMTPANETVLHRVFRDIYYNDVIGGSAVDLITLVAFGDFSLGGLSHTHAKTSEKVREAFHENMERLSIRTFVPEAAVDYLVLGEHCSSLLYNREHKTFTDVFPHTPEDLTVKMLPFYSQEPLINVKFPEDVRSLFGNVKSPRIQRLMNKLGSQVVDQIKAGSLELDPLSTIYIPRKTFTKSDRGTSYFRRLLPIYLIEKNLFRGTLVESARRQRGILHLSLGDGDTWIPTVQDMEFMTELFMNADSDPIGAIIATRMGVQVDELRQGGDFWKSTDFADSVLGHKCRALTISEGLLSGEANFNCVIGNTFVQTEQGLMYIEEIADRKNGKVQDFKVRVNSRYGPERCAKWLYSGKAPVIEVKASHGDSLTGTARHRILKLNEDLSIDWAYLRDLRIGDNLAVQTKPFVRKSKLKLNLPEPLRIVKGVRKELVKPEYMTPDLAFLIGALIAEGTVTQGRVYFPNTDIAYLDAFEDRMQSVFGIDGNRYVQVAKGTKRVINGVPTEARADYYSSYYTSRTLIQWLEVLGLSVGDVSRTKRVPWSILQADAESQLAFLAAYIEGDGNIHSQNGRISIHSKSKQIVDALFAIIQSHGFNAKKSKFGLLINVVDSAELYNLINPYLVTKSFDYESRQYKNANSFGFPSECIRSLLKDRRLKSTNRGLYFKSDDGSEVLVNGYKAMSDKMFMYDAYDTGKYDKVLEALSKVSPAMYRKVMELVKLRYRFVSVVSVRNAGKQDVYDLSMQPGVEPAYVANGFVSHNTADQSLTIFLEMIRSFREVFTRKLFYDKLFPLISLINGFTLDSKGRVSVKDGLMNSLDSEEAMFKLNDGSKLFIPNVHWTKQLKPEGDSSYMDMLNSLTEKGVPVPLRVLAAAGGMDLDMLLRQQQEDLDIRKKIADYKKQIDALAPKSEDMESESASLLALANADPTGRTKSAVISAGGRRIPLLDRDFGESGMVRDSTKTGKAKHVMNQKSANDRVNRMIAQAAAKLQTRRIV